MSNIWKQKYIQKKEKRQGLSRYQKVYLGQRGTPISFMRLLLRCNQMLALELQTQRTAVRYVEAERNHGNKKEQDVLVTAHVVLQYGRVAVLLMALSQR